MADLILPLKRVYFDKIRTGEKTHEFRLVTDFWHKRLVRRNYRHVILTLGYPKGGGQEGTTRLTRKWRGYVLSTILHEHFGPQPVTVFAIDVSEAA